MDLGLHSLLELLMNWDKSAKVCWVRCLEIYETVFQPVGLESQSNCGFCTDKMPTEILRCPYQTKYFMCTIRFILDFRYVLFWLCDKIWSKVATKWSGQCCQCACVCLCVLVLHLRKKKKKKGEIILVYFTTASHTATLLLLWPDLTKAQGECSPG